MLHSLTLEFSKPIFTTKLYHVIKKYEIIDIDTEYKINIYIVKYSRPAAGQSVQVTHTALSALIRSLGGALDPRSVGPPPARLRISHTGGGGN